MTTETAGRSAPLLHLADRVLNRPLLVHPDKAAIVAGALSGRIGLGDGAFLDAMTPDASRFYGTRQRQDGSYSLNPASDGVAIITVAGSLVNRGAWVGASSGLVSYEGLSAQVAEATADPAVRAVIFDIDSGGGEAGGVTALGASIAALAAKKRTVAVVNDTACSAAYWIASQCREIVISETSAVGSIGVVVLHVDRSGEMADMGWVPTLIHAGAHKVDGHPFAPLPDAVRADWQASIDDLHRTFCEAVARGRGRKMDADQARATQARVFYGKAAIAAGLADRVGTFEAVLAELKQRPAGGAAPKPKGNRMDNENQPAAGINAEAHAAAVAEATKAGATAERARISAILTCEAAAERPRLAQKVALETDLPAEAAAAIISAAAPENRTGIRSLAERSKESPEPGLDMGGSGVGASSGSAEDAEARRKRVVAKVSGGAR